jgi:hypothetical protein
VFWKYPISACPVYDFFTRATCSGVPWATTRPPFFAAFGAEVDDPIGVADHVQIVLDDDDRIAQVGEPMEHFEQLADVVEVEAGGGLVEQVERLAGLALAQLTGQLDALGFAAGESGYRFGLSERSQGPHQPGFAISGGR